MDDEATPPPVGETYDRIATHFSSTREYPWPEVVAFLGGDAGDGLADEAASILSGAATPEASQYRGTDTSTIGTDRGDDSDTPADQTARVGVDLGCGNGRHAEVLADRVETVVGADVSGGLLRTARERALDRGFDDALALLQADAASLPLATDAVDVAVYVATLHHIRPRDRRVASLSELARVLAPGGRGLVSAWSTAHDRFDAEAGFDTTIPWTLPGGERVPRYYHIYDPAEFAADLRESDLQIVDTVVSSGNCYAVVAPGGSA